MLHFIGRFTSANEQCSFGPVNRPTFPWLQTNQIVDAEVSHVSNPVLKNKMDESKRQYDITGRHFILPLINQPVFLRFRRPLNRAVYRQAGAAALGGR